MYEYLVTYSYYQGNRRVKEHDTFFAKNAQEAADECRAENVYLFSELSARIETIHRDTNTCWVECGSWD